MNAFLLCLRKNHLNLCPSSNSSQLPLWASKSTNLSFAVFLILRNTSQTHRLGTWLTIRIVTQTMKHLGIAYILFFTEPMKVLALVLGSKLTNHWGIVLSFFVYIHFVPNLKIGAKVYIFINVRKTVLSDCLRQILFLNYRKFQIFNLDGCEKAKISVLCRIICSLQNEWPIVVRP